MKIGVISDLHMVYDRDIWRSRSKDIALKYLLDEIDCLVMCGDNAEPDMKLSNQRKLFEALRDKSDIPIAFITGNHDLIGHVLREGVTITELQDRLSQYSKLAEEYGIIHLEDRNLEFNGVTILGTYGHYDSTLNGGRFQKDYDSVAQLVSDLNLRAEQVSGKKLLVTHSVPNKVMIGRPDGPVQDQYTPFAGSLQLEDAIRGIKPDWHFCGHTHAPAHSRIGNTKSYNVGTDYNNFFYLVVDTSDKSVTRLEKRL